MNTTPSYQALPHLSTTTFFASLHSHCFLSLQAFVFSFFFFSPLLLFPRPVLLSVAFSFTLSPLCLFCYRFRFCFHSCSLFCSVASLSSCFSHMPDFILVCSACSCMRLRIEVLRSLCVLSHRSVHIIWDVSTVFASHEVSSLSCCESYDTAWSPRCSDVKSASCSWSNGIFIFEQNPLGPKVLKDLLSLTSFSVL